MQTRSPELDLLPPEWEIGAIGDHFEIQLGKMLSPRARRGLSPRPYLRNANVQWGRFDLGDVFEMDFDEREARKFRLDPGDILICEGGEPGRTAIWRGEIADCSYQKALHRLRPKTGRVLPEFFAFWMEAALRVLKLNVAAGVRTTIAHLPAVRLATLPVPIPLDREQRSIADALGCLQARVAAEGRRVDALRSLKAATMAKLLREGLRGERLRQSEIGEIPESWKLRLLADLVSFPSGLVDPREEPFSSMTNVGPENIESGTSRLLPCRTARDLGLISGKYQFKLGDVLFSKIRPYLKKATTATWEGLCSADMYALRPCEGVDPDFVVATLLSDTCMRQITSHQARTGIPKVNREQLGGVRVPVPIDREEQIAIGLDFRLLSRAYEFAVGRHELLQQTFSTTLGALMTGRLRLPEFRDA